MAVNVLKKIQIL